MSAVSFYALSILAIILSRVAPSTANGTLTNLYKVARYRTQGLDSDNSAMYANMTTERYNDADLVVLKSDVTTISGMDQLSSYFETFRQYQTAETTHLISQHLACLTTFNQALSRVRSDELWIKDQEENSLTYEGRLGPIINEAVSLRSTFMRIIQQLGDSFDPSTVETVSFDSCDVNCRKKRVVYVIQEFDFYLQETLINIAYLLSS